MTDQKNRKGLKIVELELETLRETPEMTPINDPEYNHGEEPLLHQDHHHKKSFFIYFVTFIAAVGGFLFGYDTGVVSGASLLLQREFVLTDFEIEWVVSIALVGMIANKDH